MPTPRIANAQQICLDLIHADDEQQVIRILERYGLDPDSCWVPLGGIENNLSIVGNQQSCATASLVEKLVNSIDSLLLLGCRRRGIDPESAQAPPNMLRASTDFFGIPGGNIANIKPQDRGKIADNVQLVATGSKTSPCFTIIDLGEGQSPSEFPNTFCSLVRSNKLRVPFVQGKFNMGGCGTLPFCGERHFQLVVSRRNPELVGRDCGGEVSGWGFTLMRRQNPSDGRRSSVYEFLAPDGQVLWFDAKHLPVRPSKELAYENPLPWGTLIKLYNYQIEHRSAVVFDLSFELSRRLYHLPLPIRLCERRDYRGHSRETILTGMSVRLQDDRAGSLEDGFPDSGIIHVDGVGDVPVEVIVFKKGQGRNFLSPQAAILFTVNGQVHGGLGRRILSRESVALEFLKNDLMVVVNCTEIPTRIREDLFMPSRDRLRECAAKQALDQALEGYLREHEELNRLNLLRREEELANRLSDDKPLTDALKNVIETSPELKKLFGLGITIPVKDRPGEIPEPFEGVPFPTFFRFAGKVPTIECPVDGVCRGKFETDAENEYFTRPNEPGTLTVSPASLFKRVSLHDGRATLVLSCPAGATPGQVVDFVVTVTDPRRAQPFVHMLKMLVVPPKDKKESDNDPKPPKSGGLSLPKIIEVSRDEWEAEGFGPESGLAMQRDVDGSLIAKVNVANEHLAQSLLRTREADRDLARKRFIYGLVLSGVSFWKEFEDQEERDVLVRKASSAIARILLPVVQVLGNLGVGL